MIRFKEIYNTQLKEIVMYQHLKNKLKDSKLILKQLLMNYKEDLLEIHLVFIIDITNKIKIILVIK